MQNVSVIVPVYNAEKIISECIESILALDYPKDALEVIAVDNGSSDGTAAVLSRYRGRVRILGEKKRGAAAARNRGLVCARGDIVALTDADCLVDRHWLSNLIAPLVENGIGIVGGKILAQLPCSAIEAFGERIHDHQHAIETFKPGYVITMNWAARLPQVNELGLFDETLIRGQDVDFSWRVLQEKYRLVYEPSAIVYHRNERTLGGLFHEGFTHGYHGVRVHKKHAAFLIQAGGTGQRPHGYREILSGLAAYARGRATVASRCSTMFDAGKKLGKVFGSVRWLYPEF